MGGGGEVGQVEQGEQVEQVQVTEEAMAQVRGTGRDGGRLYADVVRERRVSTANRFELLQGEQKRDQVIYMGDSIVRKIDRTVYRGRREKTTTVCLPGARVDDVRKRVGQVMGPGTGGRFVYTWGRTTQTRKERQRSWIMWIYLKMQAWGKFLSFNSNSAPIGSVRPFLIR